MFTGIVERTARVAAIEDREGSRLLRLRVEPRPGLPSWRKPAPGDSISVNGACLTAVAARDIGDGGGEVDFEAVPETLRLTNLGALSTGDAVNIEPSLRAGDVLGGHWVTGHVDGLGTVRSRREEGGQVLFEVALEPRLLREVICKGSIAVDGISLTVVEVDRRAGWFSFAAIPHTMERTALGERTPGSRVNIETDAFGKWVLHGLEEILGREGGAGRDDAVDAIRRGDGSAR